jgi:hypothetical protein
LNVNLCAPKKTKVRRNTVKLRETEGLDVNAMGCKMVKPIKQTSMA